jgi:Protein of unknown function (DUF1501)
VGSIPSRPPNFATDKIADSAANRRMHYLDVLATVYHNLGIDPHGFVQDKSGRR